LSRKIPPTVEAQAAAAMAAGWPLTAVAEQTGISISTLKRIKGRTGVRPGSLRDELIADARQGLRDALKADYASIEAAKLVRAQVALCNGIQIRTAELLEYLQIGEDSDPLRVARTLSALSTAAKLSSDSLRQVLSLAASPEQVEQLPELIVREYSPEEETAIRESRDSACEEWSALPLDL